MRSHQERVIQEYVPGKEVSLIHLIANPGIEVVKALNYRLEGNAIGLITISPSEAAIIAADLATKSGSVSVEQIDEGNGSVVIKGDMSSVEYALEQVRETLGGVMNFAVCPLTRT
ncbi:BMC domain-containing protein [Photobacterium sp. DNB23_23_1]|uniref:BMC domain-containing protein n=1 Tax=Photobacterium pectinilyticum TaxID=2906793 RepID=A0ABT1N6C2_9GAMM|nr:BMC domain-containing protein [Photobacterium sp. ZSDE20]MCQ1059652.1 BMC domain-containing protein [Photobacterium sp. ZSDE20]MDD1825834.1 BMC domain-containing protein [Photobacterium sp. ZSDE20]